MLLLAIHALEVMALPIFLEVPEHQCIGQKEGAHDRLYGIYLLGKQGIMRDRIYT